MSLETPLMSLETPLDDAGAAAIVVEELVEALEVGRIVPGQRLAEPDLCLRFAVSRSSAREALQRLAAVGVVELSRHRGARVREISLPEALRALEVTELLAGLTARSAAHNIAAAGALARLDKVHAQLDAAEATGDERVFVQARRAFYITLLDIGGNTELTRVSSTIQIHVLRAQFRHVFSPSRLIPDYRRILRAVCDGDAGAAEDLAREHIISLRAELQQTVIGRPAAHG